MDRQDFLKTLTEACQKTRGSAQPLCFLWDLPQKISSRVCDTRLTLSILRNFLPLMPFHCRPLEHFDTSPVIIGLALETHAQQKRSRYEKSTEICYAGMVVKPGRRNSASEPILCATGTPNPLAAISSY